MGQEQRGSRPLVGDVLDPLVESIDVRLEVLIQRLELAAAIRRVRWQRQGREQRLALSCGHDEVPLLAKGHIGLGTKDRLEAAKHRNRDLRHGDVLRCGELLPQAPG